MPLSETGGADRIITDLDIARLLTPLVDMCSSEADEEIRLGTINWLSDWEIEIDVNLAEISGEIRSLRGHAGYQQRAALFSRRNDHRKGPLLYLLYALRTQSRRELDRWSWTLYTYAHAIKEFARSEQRRQENIGIRREVTQVFSGVQEGNYKVLDAQRAVRERLSENIGDIESEVPQVRQSALQRLLKLYSAFEQFGSTEVERLKSRDASIALLPPKLRTSEEAAMIARIRSLSAQCDAYASLLRQYERQVDSDRLLDQINEFNSDPRLPKLITANS